MRETTRETTTGVKRQSSAYVKIVDQYAGYIESPVLRLKFLNNALKDAPADNSLMRVPFVGSLPERARLIVELSKFLPPDRPAPFVFRLTSLLYRARVAVYAICVVFALVAGAGVVYAVSKAVGSLSGEGAAKNVESSAPSANGDAAVPDKAVAAIGSEAGLPLDKVWLVEKTDAYELYSNSARIQTEFETTGAERKFYRFELEKLPDTGDDAGLHAKPVGILYHISESDLLPFSDKYNDSLIHHSESLLEYARRNKLYNYLIDRFGRIFRIVADDGVAHHAGNSIWTDGRYAYVNLNSSFIGVSFEGKSSAGKGAEGINEAQIYAARVLTAVLRSKYQINDANCTAHGLVSTNPTSRLLGHHTDWVANFPFEAVGLTNKYDNEMQAISRFGFAYDQAYLRAGGGGRWAGLIKADAALWDAAKKNGFVIEEQRRSLWRNFERAYDKQHALDEERLAAATATTTGDK